MSGRHLHRLTLIMLVLVLGLVTLQTSFAQRPLPGYCA